MELEVLIGQFGVAGVIIGGLIWDRFRILKENETLQKEVRELYREQAATFRELTVALKHLAGPATGE